MTCRLGLVALGDSITRGAGVPALGVPARSWALWLAEALELPYTNLAADAAEAATVVRDQLPRVQADYDVAAVYIGVNDARGPDWHAQRYADDLGATLVRLRASAPRVIAFTIPLDLGRPRAGQKVDEANALIRSGASEHGVSVVELSDLNGWRLVLPDAVHLTAIGQLELADRAALALGADRLPSALADPHRSRRAVARFGARWTAMLARDLIRRRAEAVRLR